MHFECSEQVDQLITSDLCISGVLVVLIKCGKDSLCILCGNKLSHNMCSHVSSDLVSQDYKHEALFPFEYFNVFRDAVGYVVRIENFFNAVIAGIDLNLVDPVVPLMVSF